MARVRRLGFGLGWVYFIYFITQENPRIVLVTRCSDGSEIASCHFEASEITSSLLGRLVDVGSYFQSTSRRERETLYGEVD